MTGLTTTAHSLYQGAPCNGEAHHLKKGKALVDSAFTSQRWRDRTPMRRSEVVRYRRHKFCLTSRRDVLVDYRHDAASQHRKARARRLRSAGSWCSPSPVADGGGCWEIPAWCVMRESGGSWSADNPSSDARGAYQLLGHGEPWPVDSRADALKHHAIAAGLYRSQGLGPWVAC